MFFYRILIINMLSKNKSGHMVRLGDVHIPLVNIDVNEWGDRKTYELQDLVCIYLYFSFNFF